MYYIKERYFTLLELAAVIVIVMVFFGIMLGLFGLIVDRMNTLRTEVIVKQLTIAMQSYKEDQGYYFINATPFKCLNSTKDPVAQENRFKFNLGGVLDSEFIKRIEYESLKKGGYIKNIPGPGGYSYIVDGWGRSLIYKCPGRINSTMFDLGSLGKGGKYGVNSNLPSDFGKGDDITNFN